MPGRRKIFFGWYIVGAGFLSNLISIGITIFAVSAFVVPMTSDLGWSKTAFSGAQSMANLLRGLADPILGPLVDRHGTRRFLIGGAIILALGFLALATVHELWQFYLIWGVVVMLGATSTGAWVVSIAISNWFVHRRAMMIALAGMGSTLGVATMLPLSGFLIESVGWRTTWMVLAALAGVVIIPPAFFFMKRRPEDMGLRPYGMGGTTSAGGHSPQVAAAATVDVRWTRGQAARTRAFWLILISSSMISLASQGLAFHMIPFMIEDKGFSTAYSVSLIGIMGLWSTGMRPFWGMLIEKVGSRKSLAVAGFLASVGLFLLVQVHSLPLVILGLALRNLGASGYLPGMDTIWPENFGRLSLGAIRSLASPFSVAMGALGPLLPGFLDDRLGSYYVPFTIISAAYMISGLVVLFARQPFPEGARSPAAEPVGANPPGVP